MAGTWARNSSKPLPLAPAARSSKYASGTRRERLWANAMVTKVIVAGRLASVMVGLAVIITSQRASTGCARYDRIMALLMTQEPDEAGTTTEQPLRTPY